VCYTLHSMSDSSGTRQRVVSLDDVTLLRGGSRVFEHTHWTVHKGEHWAIVGGTGSGKSTLARALAREIPVVAGRVSYFFAPVDGQTGRPYFERGDVINVSPDSYRAFVRRYATYYQARWQSFEGGMCPTVADLLSAESIENRSPYQLDPLRVDARTYDVRRRRAVSLLGIGHLLGRKVLHLSNGEGRKILLARALMQAPSLLILDDPMGGLDRESREAFQGFLETILADETGPTVILVSPRAEEIPADITHLAVVEHSALVRTLSREGLQADGLPGLPAASRHPAAFPASLPSLPTCRPKTLRPADTSPLISIANASVKYGQTAVLRDVSWIVNEGENWAVLGPNGAGKTTLLSLILGDNPQVYSNDVRLFGRKRGTGESIWDVKARIGYVSPDMQALYPPETPCLSVVLSGFFDSIGLHTGCTAAQEHHARSWMRGLGLADLEGALFGDVSSGQQRLVLLARALVKDPPLLVLDEPCQSLPLDGREMILGLLDRLCERESLSLVCVSHHQDEIPRAVGHVLHLADGQVQRVERRPAQPAADSVITSK
jgi:molybdate transport system ATP-binding protein